MKPRPGPSLDVVLEGFADELVESLPTWDGAVRWMPPPPDEIRTDYRFALKTGFSDGSSTILISATGYWRYSSEDVEVVVIGNSEKDIVSTLAHCFILPSIFDGSIGIDYADFTNALSESGRGLLLASMECNPDSASIDIRHKLALRGADVSKAKALAWCFSAPSAAPYSGVDAYVAHLAHGVHEDALELLSEVKYEGAGPTASLLLLY